MPYDKKPRTSKGAIKKTAGSGGRAAAKKAANLKRMKGKKK